MKHVRLPFLAKEYITQKVDKEPLLEGNIVCKNLIIEALTEINTVRKPVEWPKILLVIIIFIITKAPCQPSELYIPLLETASADVSLKGQPSKAIRSLECYDLRE
uniref:Uncharacterized protein n=1 Tax=Glossina pallidipes TaxID=7398 RepID=A0A1A9ZM70_GLOPL